LRVNRDIVVQRAADGELQVLSREPGVRDQRMMVQLPDEDPGDAVCVRVIDSKPVMVQGVVRHLLRLHVIGSGEGNGNGNGGRIGSSQEGGS